MRKTNIQTVLPNLGITDLGNILSIAGDALKRGQSFSRSYVSQRAYIPALDEDGRLSPHFQDAKSELELTKLVMAIAFRLQTILLKK